MRLLRRIPLLAAATTAALGLMNPQPAEACGGTFCDNLPQPMPIDQTGENILFVVDGPSVEAHIQINIAPDADAEKFAWVIPVASLPEFSIGSDPLFNSLLSASVPQYGLSTEGECAPGFGGDDGGGFISDPDGGGVSLEEELHTIVGALDITVLSGGSADELAQWLVDNDYAEDESAVPILEEYIGQGWMFAAVKLANNVELDEVHPVVMRYDNGDPCVPLRLTRIAAQEDMEVRTFFLGDARVAPTNYKHVLVNPLKIDWLNRGDNYKEVVTMAVDQEGADGKAFVTEFAGASEAVPRNGIWSEAWDPDAFAAAEAEDVIDLLQDQGLGGCGAGFCQFGHPLVVSLLRDYLPPPEGMEDVDFWGDLHTNVDSIDLTVWDAGGFAADFRERVLDPGLRAIELLDTWPYLTRLFTTISPAEMTVDPIFHPHPDLPPVPANRFGTRNFDCALGDGASVVTLPGGRQVYLPNEDAAWPSFGAEMPWVEDVVELMEDVSAPLPIVDNTDLIDELLAAYNAQNMPDPGGTGTTGGGLGTSGGLDGSDTVGVDFPGDGTGRDDAGQDELDNVTSGCACQAGRGVGGGVGFGFGLLLAGLATRRRPEAKSAVKSGAESGAGR